MCLVSIILSSFLGCDTGDKHLVILFSSSWVFDLSVVISQSLTSARLLQSKLSTQKCQNTGDFEQTPQSFFFTKAWFVIEILETETHLESVSENAFCEMN